MSWKHDIEAIDRATRSTQNDIKAVKNAILAMSAKVSIMERKMDKMMSLLQGSERMADKLIEMAMVQRGMGREATSHRRAQETMPDNGDPWSNNDENQWPPPGYDAVTMP